MDTWSLPTEPLSLSETETVSGSQDENYAEECNAIRGSDGSLFPPFIKPSETLYIYNKAMCRSLGLEFSVSMEGREERREVSDCLMLGDG